MSKVSLYEILKKIGFRSTSDSRLELDFGNFKLVAVEAMNRYLKDIVYFSGINQTERRLGLIEFEIPQEVDSFEQGVAFLSFKLGRDFEAKNVPAWYHQGLLWKSLLPWEQSKLAYSQKPSATIEHDYFKLIVQKMRKKSDEATEDDITTLSFNGNTLTINCLGERIIAPATGNPWEEVSLKTRSLAHLPQRIKQQIGTIYIWESRLHVANYVLPLLTELST
ncbi:hypothetical protein [Spirosoma sp.]|uniref:hypothetical protein n=1 Tax=Spirosoma sp. TaxID=1899569 RepID=UPI003B3ACEB6